MIAADCTAAVRWSGTAAGDHLIRTTTGWSAGARLWTRLGGVGHRNARGAIMEGSELDVLGPVDYLVVEFPAAKANFSGEMATQLGSLVDRELIRVLDLLLLRKDLDGSVEVAELNELAAVDVGELL